MKDKKGVIYILYNPSFKDYVKIGYATDIEQRLKQLNRSETIPFAFRVYAVYEVGSGSELTDKKLHQLIDVLNPDLRAIDNFGGKERVKEFYAISAEEAYSLLECIAKISGTSDRLKRLTPDGHAEIDEEIAEEVRERRKQFRFTKNGIPAGSEIEFIDDPTIKAIVMDDRKIQYQGEITSLSALARKLKGCNHPLQGTLFFSYKGEILDDIRKRLEKKVEDI